MTSPLTHSTAPAWGWRERLWAVTAYPAANRCGSVAVPVTPDAPRTTTLSPAESS